MDRWNDIRLSRTSTVCPSPVMERVGGAGARTVIVCAVPALAPCAAVDAARARVMARYGGVFRKLADA